MDLPRAGPALKAVLFDLDGVIRHWRGRAAAGEEAAGLPRGAIARIAFDLPEYAASQVGAVTHLEWAAAIGRRLVSDFGPGADAAVGPWLEYRGDIDASMVSLVAAVRRAVPVGLVSNATDRLLEDLTWHGLHDAFDVIVGSAGVRLVKPDPAIYRLAAARLGVDPAECFFTDDLPANVEGARATGLHAVLFTGRDALVAELRNAAPPNGWFPPLG